MLRGGSRERQGGVRVPSDGEARPGHSRVVDVPSRAMSSKTGPVDPHRGGTSIGSGTGAGSGGGRGDAGRAPRVRENDRATVLGEREDGSCAPGGSTRMRAASGDAAAAFGAPASATASAEAASELLEGNPESPPDGFGRMMWIALPYVLILLSFILSVFAVDVGMLESWTVPWMCGTTVVLVIFRVWWQRTTASGALRWGLYSIHVLAMLFTVMFWPFFAIAAFIGYIDTGPVRSGRLMMTLLVATATTAALGQSGGLAALLNVPILFVVLLVVNVGIAASMEFVARRSRATLEKLAATVAELRASEERNEQLRERLVEQARRTGIDDERARLAREMHDTVAQGLVAVITQLEGAEAADPSPEARARITLAQASARDSLGEVRRTVHALSSPRLDDADLSAALERLVAEWSAQNSIEGSVHVDGEVGETRHDGTLLRVAQESLSNVARHSGATRVVVTLTAGGSELRLDVRDNGRGFAAETASESAGRGLDGIRRRMSDAGGSVVVESEPGAGCTVSVAVSA